MKRAALGLYGELCYLDDVGRDWADVADPRNMAGMMGLGISVEEGKVILWGKNKEDIVLNRADIESINPIGSDLEVTELATGGGNNCKVNAYRVELNNGETGILRLLVGYVNKVLNFLS